MMFNWCRSTNQMHLLCRSIALYDRITWDVASIYAPICLAISYILVANYIDENDVFIEELLDMFDITDIHGFMQSLLGVCSFLEWNIYELPADVVLYDMITNSKQKEQMFTRLYDIQKNFQKEYTMNDLVKAFIG